MGQKTHVYGWDDEPAEERPSEFSSTGYSSLSGFYATSRAHSGRRSRSRFGFTSMVVFSIALLALGGWALLHFAPIHHV